MSVRYKVHALLAQWVRRYATAPNAWAYMMTFWLFDRLGVDPKFVLATLSLFLLVASGLPAFYRALLRAWTALHGSLSQARLIVGSADTTLLRTDSLTCKSCYQLFLSLNPEQPHCVPIAVSVRSLVTIFISVFLSVVRVCLPRSPLLAALCSEFFA